MDIQMHYLFILSGFRHGIGIVLNLSNRGNVIQIDIYTGIRNFIKLIPEIGNYQKQLHSQGWVNKRKEIVSRRAVAQFCVENFQVCHLADVDDEGAWTFSRQWSGSC